MITRLAIAFLLAAFPQLNAQFSFTKNSGNLELHHGEDLITALRTDYRFPFLYPVHSPSGANITRNWPMNPDTPGEDKDHPHHRGIWLAHGSVNGYDFWADTGKKNPTIRLNSITDKQVKNGIAQLTADLTWTAETKELLQETRSYTFSKPNPETLRVKGPTAKSTLTNSNDDTNLAAWGKRANWATYIGPDELGKPAVVAIINHPSSFRYPTHWHARDYGLLAANPFGIHDFEKKKDENLGNHTLRKTESITLSHSVIIHHGTLETAKLDEIFNSLAKP